MQKSIDRFCKGIFMPVLIFLHLFILICGQSTVLAGQLYSELSENVQLKVGTTSVADIIKSLEQQTNYTFVYDPGYLAQCHVKPIEVSDNKLSEVLKWLDERAPLDILYSDNKIMIRKGVQEKPAQVKNGYISGKVVDNKNEPLPGVTVKTSSGKGVLTGVDGTYQLELEPGKYTLDFSFISYTTKRITDINVGEKKVTVLNIVMQPSSSALKEVVITANYQKASVEGLYAIQKNNAALSDGISAEQIRVTPDNNAAQVLKRVSGLTVQDDKFVTVRGLSERYNNVMLNGANLPSTEPNRRNFSFDVVPSGLIDNIIVNKTATPDMSAEFAGGLVQVNTRDIPVENFTSITLGTGINTNSTGKDFYATQRGGKDYLGFDDGTRKWWNKEWNADEYRKAAAAGDNVKTSQMNAHIPNNWGLRKYNYSPVQNYQLSLGRRIKIKEASTLGISVAATYRNEQVTMDEERYQPSNYHYDSTSSAYQFYTAIGAVANIGFQTKGHKIIFKNLYNRRLQSETDVYYGDEFNFLVGSGTDRNRVQYYNTVTIINELLQNRLEGEHLLSKHLKFDWSGDYITVNRDQPDTRASKGYYIDGPKGYYQYVLNDNNGYLTQGLNIFNSRLEERRQNAAANFSIPFKVKGANELIKFGYAGNFRQADFKSTSLRLFHDAKGNVDSINNAVYGLADYQLQSLLKPGYLTYKLTSTGAGDNAENYEGNQKLHAVYGMVDLNFLKHFRFIGGVRMESNSMNITGVSFSPVTGLPADTVIQYKRTDWLPSFNLVYSVTPAMNIRMAYSKTLARADFRERAPFIYYEFRERSIYRGSTSLKDARITNFDLRYEYYPGPGEIISVSAFHKKFDSPVELVSALGSPELIYFYFNLKSSTNNGIEVDLRKSLGFISPGTKWLKNVYVNANGSWMDAKVKYDVASLIRAASDAIGGAPGTSAPDTRKRPLQGLSPYVINAGIGYFGNVLGANVSYNKYGRRIQNGGVFPYQDQYEKPRDVLDLQLSAMLLKNKLQLRMNISDLLQQDYIIYQNISATSPYSSGGGAFVNLDEAAQTKENVNNDPKGLSYNKQLDYVYHKWFKGRSMSFNVTYNF
jgi:TonB-dependent receptor